MQNVRMRFNLFSYIIFLKQSNIGLQNKRDYWYGESLVFSSFIDEHPYFAG